MSRVLAVTPSADLAALVQQAWGPSFLAVSPSPLPTTSAGLFTHLHGALPPHVVVLDPGEDLASALALAADLDEHHAVSVILVSDRGATIGLEAMRAGVRDVVPTDATPAELRAALDRAALLATSREQSATPPTAPENAGFRGQIVTVASPKGGVGKTTVATNLAVGLAQKAPQRTVLVDLDVHFGDVASALNLSPEFTLPDMAHGPASRDSLALKTYLSLHETGLYVVPGSDSPAAADAVTAKDVVTLLDTLASEFQYVIVDTAPGLSEHTLAVLDHTDVLVVVTSLDVPGVRGLRKELDTLNDLGMLLGSRRVVLNFTDPSRGLTVADVEATIRTKIDVVLPQTNLVPISVNQGIPLLQSGGRDPFTRKLRELVDLVAPDQPSEEARSRGLFGRPRRAKESR